ncbi:MAG: GNAT family N-acetyltransferase [Candidatus Heimdallarchaeota archaeon]|nr:MAG: GNAT family N-acetyltransferase [Candidatus Heimdallarchaeota archaeon]
MVPIEIKGFDPNQLEELAKEQTAIYNAAIAKIPDTSPAKVEDTIARFKRETFDQSRMFYAYEGDRMIAYAGLTGRNEEQNLRGVGYPWLRENTDVSVRDLLYEAMENKCHDEGTKLLRVYGSPNFPEQLEYFKSKGFEVIHEFLVHEKVLEKNDYELPAGYIFRPLKRDDLPILEEVSRNDPKMKSPFVASDWEQLMDSNNYNPDSIVVVEKNGTVVGFYAFFIPSDPERKRAYFAGVAVLGDNQEIEPFLFKELENRALEQGKEKVDITFYPDSPRLPLAKELGFTQYSHSYQLDKTL